MQIFDSQASNGVMSFFFPLKKQNTEYVKHHLLHHTGVGEGKQCCLIEYN